MNRPLIFSGTTEGRTLSEKLSAAGIAHIVCVATEYGGLVMEPSRFADVRKGRKTALEMYDLMKEEAGIVFDATHPYAADVSRNILTACRAAAKEYANRTTQRTEALNQKTTLGNYAQQVDAVLKDIQLAMPTWNEMEAAEVVEVSDLLPLVHRTLSQVTSLLEQQKSAQEASNRNQLALNEFLQKNAHYEVSLLESLNRYSANEIQARQNGLVEDAPQTQAAPPAVQQTDSTQLPSLNLPQK